MTMAAPIKQRPLGLLSTKKEAPVRVVRLIGYGLLCGRVKGQDSRVYRQKMGFFVLMNPRITLRITME